MLKIVCADGHSFLKLKRRFFAGTRMVVCLLVVFVNLQFFNPALAAEKSAGISLLHCFTDEFGQAGLHKVLKRFSLHHRISVTEDTISHKDFKNVVVQMAAESQLPDVTSYWAGSRMRFLVDNDALVVLDHLWSEGDYTSLVPRILTEVTTCYNGHRYLVPLGYHAVGFFYNPKVFQAVGIERPPERWEELLTACEKLLAAGIKPFALGAKNRWPAQFWFDYLLLRTAGTEFRNDLMTGKVSYLDPPVQEVMRRWAALLKKDYFTRGILTDDWTDAADQVAAGKAAMTLMGTWVTGYWDRQGLQPVEDYAFFAFPEMLPGQKRAVVGLIDGLVMGSDSRDPGQAEALIDFLLTDLTAQKTWVRAQGALSPNKNFSAENYNPVMQEVLQEVEGGGRFVFTYDLATCPPVAEQGLSVFAHFLHDPDSYQEGLATIAQAARACAARACAKGELHESDR